MNHAHSLALPRFAGILLLAFFAAPGVAQPPPETASLNDFEEIRALFEPRGWRVERGEEGYLNLYPPTDASVSRETIQQGAGDKAPAAATEAAGEQVISLDNHQGLSDALKEHGWSVSKAEDGSMLLYPPGEEEGGSSEAESPAPALPEPLAGEVIAPIESGEIGLPVDSWKKARDLALRWLDGHGVKDVNVGRIRLVNRVYIVSIVESKHPFHLVAQLVIRAENGVILRVA
jgi:hypothetical protein